MGCIICNLIASIDQPVPKKPAKLTPREIAEIKNEIANDIAVMHPEIYKEIKRIRRHTKVASKKL